MSEGLLSNWSSGSSRPQQNRHLTALYRGDLHEQYDSDTEMRDLELCRQAELSAEDYASPKFEPLFSGPVSGYRLADWLRLAIARALPHLQPEQIQEGNKGYTVPYMSRHGNFGRIVMNYVETEEQSFARDISMGAEGASERGLGWLYVYNSPTVSSHNQLDTYGLSLQTRLQFDAAIGLPIYVTAVRLVQGMINGDLVEEPMSLDHGEELLIVKPNTPPAERLVSILRDLDDALEFISND